MFTTTVSLEPQVDPAMDADMQFPIIVTVVRLANATQQTP